MAAASVRVGHHLDRRGRASPSAGGAGRSAHRQEPASRVPRRRLGPAVASPPGTIQAGERELMTVRTLGWCQAADLPVRAANSPHARAFPDRGHGRR